MKSGPTYARVTDGAIKRTISEADYRLGDCLPVYDALPTKDEYIANGGKDA